MRMKVIRITNISYNIDTVHKKNLPTEEFTYSRQKHLPSRAVMSIALFCFISVSNIFSKYMSRFITFPLQQVQHISNVRTLLPINTACITNIALLKSKISRVTDSNNKSRVLAIETVC